MKRYDVISVIPEVITAYAKASILGRAQAAGIIEIGAYDLRDWTHDAHRTVDDAPFGGGAGMLMKPEPIFEAVEALTAEAPAHVIICSPTGKPFTDADAVRLSHKERLLFVCGRYEGIDERVYTLADEVISVGDFVLTGGELATLCVIDAVARRVEGVLGDAESADEESFSDGLLEYAQYTRPASFRGMNVPEVLTSGDHGKVADWRRKNSLVRTALLRPDLLARAPLNAAERAFVENIAISEGERHE